MTPWAVALWVGLVAAFWFTGTAAVCALMAAVVGQRWTRGQWVNAMGVVSVGAGVVMAGSVVVAVLL